MNQASVSQGNLRLRLAEVRVKIGTLTSDLRRFKEEEAALVKAIEPVRERCQTCLGRGTKMTRDSHLGMDVEMKCYACNGTGSWEAPI